MPNILIVTDLEGLTTVTQKEPIKDETSLAYKSACEQLMRETNLAISALIDAGATKIYVLDGHASGKNFIENTLDKRAVQVWGDDLAWVMKEVEGFVMVGAHALAGNSDGFFSHTLMWEEFKVYRHNGRAVGETDIMATYAGLFNVPCIAVTGDNLVCLEVENIFNGVATAVVKRAISRDEAQPLSYTDAEKVIYNAMVKGYKNRKNIKPLKETFPLTVEVDFSTETALERWCKNRTDIIKGENLNTKSIKLRENVKFYRDLFL